MAVLLGAVKSKSRKKSSLKKDNSIIEKAKKMYSSVPANTYQEYLLRHINNPSKKIREFIREKFEKSINPRNSSFIKIQIKKLYETYP
jgi:hypothetical protein